MTDAQQIAQLESDLAFARKTLDEAVAKVDELNGELNRMVDDLGTRGAQYRDLALALERLLPRIPDADTTEVNALLDAHWRGDPNDDDD